MDYTIARVDNVMFIVFLYIEDKTKKKTDLFLSNCRLSEKYRFEKPNDRRALELMNAAAIEVMKELPDLNVAYGVSDEYRFVCLFDD
jgi:tRNAHis guanylyltransferase